jgi:peptide/nickel transport system substrate-binding protein
MATPVGGPVTPANREWYDAASAPPPHDPARAAALLEAAGLVDRNGDGIREDARGAPARFALLTQRGQTLRERGASVLQEELRAIGLAVDVVPLDTPALVDRIVRSDYDAVYFGTDTTDTDPVMATEFWLSSGGFHAWDPGQATPETPWEARVDELMRRMTTTIDQGERRRAFVEVQQIFARELPAIYFAAPRVIVAMSPRVANATPAVLRPQVLWNAETLAITRGRGAR